MPLQLYLFETVTFARIHPSQYDVKSWQAIGISLVGSMISMVLSVYLADVEVLVSSPCGAELHSPWHLWGFMRP
jgi:hypothetical protein